jgi:AcrR family transcriptional regulator
MIDDLRHRILHAAARVYAQHGWRGATTRRIAEEAGVNEVSLFRHFGSKDALLDAMMQESARLDGVEDLPREPRHPEDELLQWAGAQRSHIASQRAMVRQMMSDARERPDAATCVSQQPNHAFETLRHYVVQLRRQGRIAGPEAVSPTEVAAAVTMLMGAIFSDALHRELMPTMFSQPVDETLRAYVRIFLRGLGARPEPIGGPSRTADRSFTPSVISE